jgi:hypothetical protein
MEENKFKLPTETVELPSKGKFYHRFFFSAIILNFLVLVI